MTRRVAVLLFDNVEVMDFAGPFEVFGVAGQREGKHLFDVYTVARESKPVLARNNLSINPDYSFRDCPTMDILVVPGGFGTRREKHNPSVLDFIRQHAGQAERVLSVCSGALLLAKAGLLDGLHATTHRGALTELRIDAPTANVLQDVRVVDNGKVVLSAGISAGIDAALYLVAELHGLEQAIETATYMEYDWRHHPNAANSAIRIAKASSERTAAPSMEAPGLNVTPQ
jgi:transcriptional regulator GlxA family with amidase domain